MTNTYTAPIKNPCENLKEPISPQRIEMRSIELTWPGDQNASIDFSSDDNLWSFNVNSLVIDNSNNASSVTVSVQMVGVAYNVVCGANAVHAFPIPAVPPFKASVSSAATTGSTIIHVANFPIPTF